MEGRVAMGSSISPETVQVRWEVETVSLGMTLHNTRPPSPTSLELDLDLKLWTGRTKY